MSELTLFLRILNNREIDIDAREFVPKKSEIQELTKSKRSSGFIKKGIFI